MAKGNLFLGTAARSVGDVVMYRREGSQVSRVRVRKIANPKTDAQCEQRAFMSAVVKFYQPLANVLDRSWQGLSRAKSYAKFLKKNVGIVRENGYFLKKDTGFFPLPLQLSNGTIPSVPQEYNDADIRLNIGIAHSGASSTTIGDISADFVAAGYKNGDVVTVIAILGEIDGVDFTPISFQFIIDTTSTVALSTLTIQGCSLTYVADSNWALINDDDQMMGGAIIVSRPVDGLWQRSTQVLGLNSEVRDSTSSSAAKAAAIASYKGAAASDNPLVYLDGDELETA